MNKTILTIQDSLANKSDTAKHWQGVSQRMRCVFVSFVRRSQAFVSFVRNSQGFVRNSQAFVTICKASLVSVIILANRIVFGEFAANIKSLHSQGYSPLCESSIIKATIKASFNRTHVWTDLSKHTSCSSEIDPD